MNDETTKPETPAMWIETTNTETLTMWVDGTCPFCGFSAPLQIVATLDSMGLVCSYRVASVNERICGDCESPIPNPPNRPTLEPWEVTWLANY